MNEEEKQELLTAMLQGMHRKDKEYIMSIQIVALVFLRAGDAELEALAVRIAILLCRLLGVQEDLFRADLAFALMMAIVEGDK